MVNISETSLRALEGWEVGAHWSNQCGQSGYWARQGTKDWIRLQVTPSSDNDMTAEELVELLRAEED